MISVCMATHNGEKYLEKQVHSILSQLSPEDELIVSDDGSTDRTLALLEELSAADTRIKIVKFIQTPQKGYLSNLRYACRNFENALIHAKGDYIFLSDQDDIWYPEKVKVMMEHLQNYLLVRTNSVLITADEEPIGVSYKEGCSPLKSGLFGNIISMKFSGSHMAFRREILDKALPFPSGIVSHDNWIGCLACIYGSCYYEARPLLYYRMHGSNISKYHNNSLYIKISYRFKILSQLVWRFLKNN